ncbi:hypothetical protein ACT453_07390, partial [Bacillus sp. D-CC]
MAYDNAFFIPKTSLNCICILLTVSALSIGMLSACGPKDSGKKEESKAKKDYDLLVWEDDKKGVGLE